MLVSPLPPLVEARPHVPPALATVVARCLEKRPEHRYQSVRELKRALLAVPTDRAHVERLARLPPG